MNGNYVAMAVAFLGWVGLFIYLVGLDRRVRKLDHDES
jgi:hypothetical protein